MSNQNPDLGALFRKNPRLFIVVAVLLIGGALLYSYFRRPSAPTLTTSLPVMREKPRPVDREFRGCPPEGDGGDPDLNRLKNRIDDGNYIPVQFDAVEQLQWPPGVERERRSKWSSADTEAVERYEGLPVAVEGYLAGSKLEGPESPNCHGADDDFRDFHIWLTKTAGEDRSQSIVVEVTPPIRAKHPNWRTDVFRRIVREKPRVRISGWLMLDPEHPDQVGKTRGTIWEIHPIMQIDVEQNGRWVPLDSFAG